MTSISKPTSKSVKSIPTSLPSLKDAIKALPMKFESWSKKEREIDYRLKRRISASEKEMLRKQKAGLVLKMKPYIEFEEKLFEMDEPNNFFDQQIQKPLEKCVKNWVKVIKTHPFDEGIYKQFQEMDEFAFTLLGKNTHILEKKWIIDELIKRPLIPSGVLIEVDDDYSHVSSRKKFANSQLLNTLEFLKESCVSWPYELDMISMYLSDGFDHYRLGVELLLGDPKKIEQASSMDTASREHIDEKTWSFIVNELFHGSYKKDEGVVRAKKEKKLLEALPQALHTKPAFRI